jgi:uncharacterized membrane protein
VTISDQAPVSVPHRLERVVTSWRGPHRQSSEPTAVLERCGWSLVWLGVLLSGLGFWGGWNGWPGAALVAPLLVLGGGVGMAATWLVDDPNSPVTQRVALLASLMAVGIPQAVAIHVRQFFTTDSAAFNQVASQVLAQGRDPYVASMAPAAKLLYTPSNYWTYTVDGGHVTHVSYPAGSFLLQAPFMALGLHHQVTDWIDLVAWLVTGVLLFAMLPASLRWLSALILLTPFYVNTFANGGTDALFFPFLIVAVWRWDRFGTGKGNGLAAWIGPLCLGLACSIKQTPWFCVPILVIGVGLEAHRRGRNPWPVAGAYLAIVVGVFSVVNLPFIIWQPSAWVHGTFLPFAQPLVADGQGAVTLALHGLTGGVVLPFLSVAGVLAYVALLAAFVLWYPRMKRIWLFLLPVVLFVPGRSLSSYLIDLFPAAMIAAITVTSPVTVASSDRGGGRRWAAAMVVVPVGAALAAMAVAFTSAPLQLAVDGFRTSHSTQRLDAVTVTVHNRSDHPVTPHFMVTIGGSHPDGFWKPTGGNPPVIGPGGVATVTIKPPDYTWSPAHDTYWLVDAYTTSPNALSTSSPVFWTLGHAQS